MTKRYLGNIITQNPTPPAGAYQDSAASGVWSLAEAFAYSKAGLWPTAGNAAPFAFFFGGEAADQLTSIDRFDLSSSGNATDFGDLDVKRYQHGALGSRTRGVVAGGYDGTTFGTNRMTYITFGTTGSGSDFGDLTVGRRGGPQSVTNDTRGVWICGRNSSNANTNTMDYITIATEGNATDFGDANVSRGFMQSGGASNGTRGVTGGGEPLTNSIEYITIASTGNGTDFGDMSEAKDDMSMCSNSTRGIFFGGRTGSAINTIEYITISTTGNTTDFGDLTAVTQDAPSAASPTIAICGNINETVTVDQITIASTGNSTDFGDQLSVRSSSSGTSNVHGGLS